MIRIDLAVPRRRERLTTWHYLVIWVCVFLFVVVGAGIGLVFQGRRLKSIEQENASLRATSDSLKTQKTAVAHYEIIEAQYRELLGKIEDASRYNERYLEVMRLLDAKLGPRMKLVSFQIEADSATAMVLAPSNLEVRRYVDALLRSAIFELITSEPRGSREGLIQHRLLLRVR